MTDILHDVNKDTLSPQNMKMSKTSNGQNLKHKFAWSLYQTHHDNDDISSPVLQMKSGDPLTKPRDFLDTVLMARDADGTGLTVREIEDEASTFLFAGFETTSTTLTWVLYVLAKYPEHQDKVRDEVDDILSGRESDHITR